MTNIGRITLSLCSLGGVALVVLFVLKVFTHSF